MINQTDLAHCWHRSSYSGSGNNCVEITADLPGVIAMRDSKDPGGPLLAFSTAQWQAFSAGVKAGEFDVA